MKTVILEIKEVSFAYEKANVLTDISFEGKRKELLVIAGPNGSGKTTLIKLLFDLLERKNGEIIIDDLDNRQINAKKKMLYLPSDNILPQFLTGDEYVRLMCRVYDKEIDEKLYNQLIQYYKMEHRINFMIENYSHGMVKKIQLITAFLIQADITVVDETLNGIDMEAKEVSKILLKKLVKKNKLVVMCTHDLELANQVGDRAVLMYRGNIKSIISLQEDTNLTEIFKNLIGFVESDYEI